MAVDHDRGRMEATDAIFAKFPNLRDLLRDDTDRQRLRLGLRCPKCRKLLETVVLDSDTNDGLILRTLEEWESGDFATRHARTATPTAAPDSMTMGRIRLDCPRCPFDGVYTQAQLLNLFTLARLVLDAPDITLT